jgi:hypothetical protein
MTQVAPFFKHSGFREEEEYRIVITNIFGNDKIQFRNNGKTIIPYIPATLTGVKKDATEEEKKEKIILPLREIKVGPCEDFMQVKKGIEMLLRANGYFGVKITSSSIPYQPFQWRYIGLDAFIYQFHLCLTRKILKQFIETI